MLQARGLPLWSGHMAGGGPLERLGYKQVETVTLSEPEPGQRWQWGEGPDTRLDQSQTPGQARGDI